MSTPGGALWGFGGSFCDAKTRKLLSWFLLELLVFAPFSVAWYSSRKWPLFWALRMREYEA